MRIILTGLMLFLSACAAYECSAYHLTKTIPVQGDEGWDYVKVDDQARRVYIAHTGKVDVLDADSGKVVGSIDGIKGAHGIAIASDTGHGFITNGKSNSVTVFDLKTLKATGHIKAGHKPDAITYDAFSHRVFAFNGESDNATVIDADNNKKIATIALGGGPEFAVSDKEGHIYVNLEDKNEMLQINSSSLKVEKRWALSPCESPSSLAIDRKNHRLFAGCRNRLLTVVDATNGAVIATLPIGDKVDATAFDPETNLVISSSGDGTLSVIHEDDADHYHLAQTLATPKHSKTFGLDKKTHALFVPAAEFSDAPKLKVAPGSFIVLVFER